MDDVQAWIEEQGAYEVGLALYLQHPNHNKNLVRLFSRGESFRNRQKLEYEVERIYRKMPLGKPKKESPKPTTVVRTAGKKPEQKLQEQSAESFQGSVGLKDLHPSLHPKFIQQKNTFYRIWRLHYGLEDIEGDQRRLEVVREIMSGWEYINSVWKEIDYFMEHQRVLPDADTGDLQSLSKEKLAQRKLTTRSNISRYRKEVEKLSSDLETTKDQAKKKKLHLKLEKKRQTLGRNEVRMAAINQLLNE